MWFFCLKGSDIPRLFWKRSEILLLARYAHSHSLTLTYPKTAISLSNCCLSGEKKKVTTIFHDIITSTILQLFKCFFQCAKSSTCIILMRSLQQPGKLNSVIPHIADGKDVKMSRVACLMSTPEGHRKLSQTGSELWII